MNDIVINIKKVMLVFLILFVALISYITYIYMFNSQKAVASTFNHRLWAERNKVLRGTIYDKDMTPLTKSTKTSEVSQKQEYLQGEVFAHAIGYMNPIYGLAGLEKKYDAELMGSEDTVASKLFDFNKKEEEKVGNGLRTTLNSKLQKKAFSLLQGKRGSIVALNPKTGEILAMVSMPSYNPNNLEKDWKGIVANKDMPLLNRAVSGLYPPGSIFKTITAISALENIPSVYNKRFEDNGSLVFNQSSSLKNYDGEVFGNIDFRTAYLHSSNVVFGSLGIELGNKALKDTTEKFYFNKDIPASGLTIENSKFPSYKSNEKGNIAQSAIGQAEVLATPMEMALVASTVANDGIMMQPMLVKEILSSKGKSLKKIDPKALGENMSKENAKIMKDLMKDVVAEGTGKNAAVDGITVCGKTGTADHKGDSSKQVGPHSWFIGFAPYENPQIAIAVIVEEGGVGGGVAAEITRELIKVYLQ
ncbi:peptidoglycan D,D-transpeptidase FtsI family protein [Clostridium tagluense]|uniref:peptidoglycan D,D-transpeptidase FtsI family protein n=1 Tax=Clostridium tagluense TaxID=360422 RepID=UPI001C0E2472|nr:penicillin-binding protein 2 [Clostridium tagluense]MBU3126938.1 penicillin-binding protein 2 [Clostridium tagluense]MCB2299407.1 penicillin-binding protein 2 [Clostridium tagluense]